MSTVKKHEFYQYFFINVNDWTRNPCNAGIGIIFKSSIFKFEVIITFVKATIFEEIFKSNKSAWEFFSKQPPSFQRTVIHWIMSAKKEETKLARLKKLILESEKQKRIL